MQHETLSSEALAVIYGHLAKMFSYRNIKITSKLLNAKELADQFITHEFATIMGDRSSEDIIRGAAHVLLVMIAPGSAYANKTDRTKRLMRSVAGMAPDNGVFEIILVTHVPFTSHVIKYLATYADDKPRHRLEYHTYDPFCIEAPKHISVPRHELMSQDEVDAFCRFYNTTPNVFPLILQNDVQAIWIGARPGMVVRIHRNSDNAGYAIAYRLCVANGGEVVAAGAGAGGGGKKEETATEPATASTDEPGTDEVA